MGDHEFYEVSVKELEKTLKLNGLIIALSELGLDIDYHYNRGNVNLCFESFLISCKNLDSAVRLLELVLTVLNPKKRRR